MSGEGEGDCGFPCQDTGGCEYEIVAFIPAGYFGLSAGYFICGLSAGYFIRGLSARYYTSIAPNINSINIPFNVITSIFRFFTYIL